MCDERGRSPPRNAVAAKEFRSLDQPTGSAFQPEGPLDSFVPLPGRDASAAVRGYLYQAERTVLAWLGLDEQTVLYCECGEDIDYVQLLPDAKSARPLVLRLIEQVKLRQTTSVTLRSPEAVEALGNFLAVREANPELRILFRFFTNAQAGKEAGIAFPGGAGGINAWEQVRRGQNPRAVNDLAEGLRALFCTRDWQERSPGARVAAFLQQPVETIEQELIKPFEWAVGSPSQEQLQPAGEGEVPKTRPGQEPRGGGRSLRPPLDSRSADNCFE